MCHSAVSPAALRILQPIPDRRWSRHFTYTATYSRFLAGRFLKETQPGEDIEYVTTWLTFRF